MSDKDTQFYRCLLGPDNTRVVISRAQDGHWQWFSSQTGKGGSVVDACTTLLQQGWSQAMGELRRALDNPPPALPVALGGKTRQRPSYQSNPQPARIASAECGRPHSPSGVANVTAAAAKLAAAQTQPELQPLGERGRAYLTKRRFLAEETVSAFAHQLRENRWGSVRALHILEHGDGEERGENWKSFVGRQADGEDRGRRLWVAAPSRDCSRIIVAESFISGLSAWELLPAGHHQHTGIISTGGTLSAAGVEQLQSLLARVRDQQQARTGRKVWLLDASDQGEAKTDERTLFLAALAEQAGVGYQRYAPRGQVQDWNDALAFAKSQQPYHDVCREDKPAEPTALPAYLQSIKEDTNIAPRRGIRR